MLVNIYVKVFTFFKVQTSVCRHKKQAFFKVQIEPRVNLLNREEIS